MFSNSAIVVFGALRFNSPKTVNQIIECFKQKPALCFYVHKKKVIWITE